jgi:hypothetical protein
MPKSFQRLQQLFIWPRRSLPSPTKKLPNLGTRISPPTSISEIEDKMIKDQAAETTEEIARDESATKIKDEKKENRRHVTKQQAMA